MASLLSLGFPFTRLLVHGFAGPQVPPQAEWQPEEDPILLDVEGYQGEVFKIQQLFGFLVYQGQETIPTLSHPMLRSI